MKKQTLFYLLLFFFPVFISGCDPNATTNSDNSRLNVDTNKEITDTIATDTATKLVDTAKKETWQYSDEDDKMTSIKTYFAQVDANEELLFDFPYDGGSTASIFIRNKEKSNNVMLRVSKGQFICSPSSGCTIRIRFDDTKAETFECSEPSDYDPTTLFINSASRFIKKCKNSKKMIVEAEFYRAGLKQMEFNIEGLKWDH